MPNWTTNQLIIEGDNAQIKELLSFIKGDDEVIDFNNIIPIPKLLKHTVSGMRFIDGRKVTSWYEDTSIADWADRSKTRRLFTAKETAELKKIGYKNCFDWACDNWGTKSNACQTRFACDYDRFIEIRFDTACSPPVPIIQALRERFPNLDIQFNYRLENDPEFPHSL